MTDDKISAIVIGSRDYKEKDKLVDLFSLENGLITVVLKGVKNNNAKYKFAKEPFCFGEFVLSGSSNYSVVTQANLIDSFFDITQDYDRYVSGCKILSLLPQVLEKYQTNSQLFVLTLKIFRELAYSKIDNKLLLCTYLSQALCQLGYKINVSTCASCGEQFLGQIYLNADTCEMVCQNCRTMYFIPISASCHNALRMLSKVDITKLDTVNIDEKVLLDLLKIFQIILQSRFGYKQSLLS